MKNLQNKKQSLLGIVVCFFLNHNRVDGEFTDNRGYIYSGKCSRCGALYGHPLKPINNQLNTNNKTENYANR